MRLSTRFRARKNDHVLTLAPLPLTHGSHRRVFLLLYLSVMQRVDVVRRQRPLRLCDQSQSRESPLSTFVVLTTTQVPILPGLASRVIIWTSICSRISLSSPGTSANEMGFGRKYRNPRYLTQSAAKDSGRAGQCAQWRRRSRGERRAR